jgi:hypothetical protein
VAVTIEYAMNGVDRGHRLDRRIVGEYPVDLASAPAAALPDIEDPLDDLRGSRVRAGVRPSRSVGEPVGPLQLVAFEPLVASRTADPVTAAEFSEGELGEFRLEDEAGAFTLHGSSSPWHRDLPAEGALRLSGEL